MDDPHKLVTVPASKLIDEAGSPKVLEGRAHQRCEGCGGSHGSVNKHLACVTQALNNARKQIVELQNDPDRERGRKVREAVQTFRSFPMTKSGHAHEMSVADKRGKR